LPAKATAARGLTYRPGPETQLRPPKAAKRTTEFDI
jgi:hypothetical protein